MRLPLSFTLIVAILASPVSAIAQDLKAAKRFVVDLYEHYSHGDPEYLGRGASTTFDPELLSLLKRDQARAGRGEAGRLDWDPICGCQDGEEVKLLRIEIRSTGRSKAQAKVRLQFPNDEPVERRIDLTVEGGHWRVSDVHDDLGSLVALLRAERR